MHRQRITSGATQVTSQQLAQIALRGDDARIAIEREAVLAPLKLPRLRKKCDVGHPASS